MMGLCRLYTIVKHVVVNSMIGCRVRKLGSYIHGGRVRSDYE